MSEDDPFIVLARVGAPHGVRGDVRIKLFAESAESLTAYGPLRRADGRGTIRIGKIKPGKSPDLVTAVLGGIEDRETAAALNGVELGLPRSLLPSPEDDDEFYHADLIGLAVRLADGTLFGEVMQVANFGADDLLDIKPSVGGASVLVPFTQAVVPIIQVGEGYLVLEPPPGLLDADDEGASEG